MTGVITRRWMERWTDAAKQVWQHAIDFLILIWSNLTWSASFLDSFFYCWLFCSSLGLLFFLYLLLASQILIFASNCFIFHILYLMLLSRMFFIPEEHHAWLSLSTPQAQWPFLTPFHSYAPCLYMLVLVIVSVIFRDYHNLHIWIRIRI